jgi:uncharacterized protein (DUF1800 family)
MSVTRKLLFFAVILALVASAGWLMAGDSPSKNPSAPMDENKKILHALNRFTFGPRPGDVVKVRAMGLDKWFDQQLHPERMDTAAMDARLAPFLTLKMSPREMVTNFPPPQVLRMVENGRVAMPSDPGKRAIYESRIVAYNQQQAAKKDEAAGTPQNPQNPRAKAGKKANGNGDDAAMMADTPAENLTPEQLKERQKQQESAMYADIGAVQLLDLSPEDRYQKIIKMSPRERLSLGRSIQGEKLLQLVDGMKPEQRETVQAIVQPQAVVGGELAQAKLLRAIYSDRQLEEVMTDFWYNHFNIFIGKGPDRYMITAYERDVIRPHVLGKFKDLLSATAHSPAMLFYLDNWQSVGPNSALAKFGPEGARMADGGFMSPFDRRRQQQAKQQQQQAKNRPSGLNENYAREIMELHTLGVDGGYTQKDVTELAKVLTGWTIDNPQIGGPAAYRERAHEPGKKYVLGHEIAEQGQAEGAQMLDILAHHPSTAKFVCKKLAMRFVSDNPPQSLVDRMADTFMKKDGDIREVLLTLFHSPEFWAADAYRAKVKTPLEFVASSARAAGVDVQNALPLVQTLNRMGMPLYGMQPPTGYSTKSDAWVNSSALLTRMNFALQLGSGRLPGTTPNPQALLHGSSPQDSGAALAALEGEILSGDVSAQTHAVIQKQLNDPEVMQRKPDDSGRTPNYGAIAGLIMGSPEFQRR